MIYYIVVGKMRGDKHNEKAAVATVSELLIILLLTKINTGLATTDDSDNLVSATGGRLL